MSIKKLASFGILFAIILFSCTGSSLNEDQSSSPPEEMSAVDEVPYPYPITTPTYRVSSFKIAVPFRLNKPVVVGIQEVSGSGPAGVPIMILDITFMGNILGEGTIKPDGTFNIQVPKLEKNHRIGLTLGYLDGTEWIPEDFYSPGFNGDNPLQVPMVDFFFDTAIIANE